MTGETAMNKDTQDYLIQFTSTARALDVPGKTIGERASEIESHTADSEENPADVFGSPQEYAQKLASPSPARRPRSVLHQAPRFFAFFAGMFFLASASLSLAGQQALPLWPDFVLPTAGAIITTASYCYLERRRGVRLGNSWQLPAVFTFLVLSLLTSTWDAPSIRPSGSISLPVAIGLLAPAVMSTLRSLPRAERITDTAGQDRTTLARLNPPPRLLFAGLVLTLVVITIALTVLSA
jgi:hypothetical protein